MSCLLFLIGLFDPAILTARIDVVENVDESTDNKNETITSSTNINATRDSNNWSASTNPEHMHRITSPVIITSPQADKHRNFTASPLLGTIDNTDSHRFHHYFQVSQEHTSQYDSDYPPKELEDAKTKHQYSQPSTPDLFHAQKYLKAQQQKEREEYELKNNNKQHFPKAAYPEAKSNLYNVNTEAISYKPGKYEADFPSTYSTSEKEVNYDKKKESPFQFSLSSPVKGSTHPYPYQNPFSSGEKDTSLKNAPVSGKQYGNSWADGYKAGVTQQEG